PALLMSGSPLICEQICAWEMVSPTASTLGGHTPRCSSHPLAPGVEGTIVADPMISLRMIALARFAHSYRRIGEFRHNCGAATPHRLPLRRAKQKPTQKKTR